MRQRPKSLKELATHGEDCDAIYEFLKKYWDDIGKPKPKGYHELLNNNYCDFDGMDEWEQNEKHKQQADFKGFDISCATDFDFVKRVSAPNIVYDEVAQGRPPFMMLISAILAYGFERGRLYGQEEGRREAENGIIQSILGAQSERDGYDK